MSGLPPLELHTPATVEEATALVERHGDDAVLYAGGTELVLLMKLGFAAYGHLVDLKGIRELRGIRDEDGVVSIGAAVTHREIERSPVVAERWPALVAMEREVANIRVRNAGTIGGNLCFSDPHSDPATFLLAAGARLVARRGDGADRRIPADGFVLGPYQNALARGEVLVAVELPSLPRGAGVAHAKLAFHERPAATVSCLARVEEGQVVEARVAVGSVGSVPVRAAAAEAILTGLDAGSPAVDALEAAGVAAAEAAHAVEDAHGSSEYKENLVRVLVKRTFVRALDNGADVRG